MLWLDRLFDAMPLLALFVTVSLGYLAGKIKMSPDFSDTPEWMIDAFED